MQDTDFYGHNLESSLQPLKRSRSNTWPLPPPLYVDNYLGEAIIIDTETTVSQQYVKIQPPNSSLADNTCKQIGKNQTVASPQANWTSENTTFLENGSNNYVSCALTSKENRRKRSRYTDKQETQFQTIPRSKTVSTAAQDYKAIRDRVRKKVTVLKRRQLKNDFLNNPNYSIAEEIVSSSDNPFRKAENLQMPANQLPTINIAPYFNQPYAAFSDTNKSSRTPELIHDLQQFPDSSAVTNQIKQCSLPFQQVNSFTHNQINSPHIVGNLQPVAFRERTASYASSPEKQNISPIAETWSPEYDLDSQQLTDTLIRESQINEYSKPYNRINSSTSQKIAYRERYATQSAAVIHVPEVNKVFPLSAVECHNCKSRVFDISTASGLTLTPNRIENADKIVTKQFSQVSQEISSTQYNVDCHSNALPDQQVNYINNANLQMADNGDPNSCALVRYNSLLDDIDQILHRIQVEEVNDFRSVTNI